ncbi:hypothetical protein RV16_GL000621 [Enterococcus saccharolyticus]|nr:hypothetical protein RV16_GL000621 [Enterococcus saccharolyticus]
MLFFIINPPKCKDSSSNEPIKFSFLLSRRRQTRKNTLFFRRGKIGYLIITKLGKSNTPYLLYPDYTVGIGISPIQPLIKSGSWTITTGRELHPAPEDEPLLNC